MEILGLARRVRSWLDRNFPLPDSRPVPPVFLPPPQVRQYTPEEERAQLVEAVAWDLLRRHAPDLSPAEAFEKAEAWQRIMEGRKADEDGKVRTIENAEGEP